MGIDFSKYGTPVTQPQTDSFNKYGTPVSQPTAQAQVPQVHQSLADSIWSSIAGVAKGVTNAMHLGGVADTIGTDLAPIALATDPSIKNKLTAQNYLQDPSLKQNIGSGLALGALTAGTAVAPESIIANTALGGTLGAAAGGGQALSENKSLGEAGTAAAKGGAAGAAFSGATALAGKFLQNVGDKIQYSVIKPTKADVEDGFSLATIKKHDLGGSLNQVFTKTETKLDDLTQQLNAKLAESDSHINMADVLAKTEDRLKGNKLFSFGSNTSLDGALSQLRGEVSNVGTDLSIPDAQIVKRASGHFGAWQYGAFDPESTARQKVYNVFYNELKKAIEQNSPPGVADINKQMSELIPVLNAVIRRIPVAERNNAISLSDVIGLVGSAISPKALGFTMLNFLSKSGVVGNALTKLGGGIQSAAPAAGALGGASLPSALESVYTTPQTQSQQ